jgi:hypothetical protein
MTSTVRFRVPNWIEGTGVTTNGLCKKIIDESWLPDVAGTFHHIHSNYINRIRCNSG